MYIKTIKECYTNKRGHNCTRVRDLFQCDECGIEFKDYYKAIHATSGSLTFCGKICNKKSRSNGKLAEKWKETKRKKYGVDFSSQVPGAAEKMITKRVENTGARGPASKNSSSHERWTQTMIDRHGVDYPSKSDEIKEKKKETYQERYGIDSPFQAGSQFRATNEEYSTFGQKGYQALFQKQGDDMLSKPEVTLAILLREWFGIDQVVQQVEVHHGGRKPWLVDFYIKSIKTFVEEDGIFWHGLQLPYDKLYEKQRSMFDRDREKDEWFKSHGYRLVRVTDKELAACQKSGDWSDIVTRLGGCENRDL